jgi:hypothetical protein
MEQVSAAARADLRALVAQWWSRHAPPLSLEEAEQLALALSRELAREMTQAAMAPISGPQS